MMHYSIQPRDFVKSYGFLSFAKNMDICMYVCVYIYIYIYIYIYKYKLYRIL